MTQIKVSRTTDDVSFPYSYFVNISFPCRYRQISNTVYESILYLPAFIASLYLWTIAFVCEIHFSLMFLRFNLLILQTFYFHKKYDSMIRPVVAQGCKRATVNVIGCGFDSLKEMKYLIISFFRFGVWRGVDFRHSIQNASRIKPKGVS